MTASRDSAAPRGLPGRFRTNDFLRTPQSARLRAAGANGAGGFGSDVALGDSGSTGCCDQAGFGSEANDCLLNGRLIVSNDFSCDHRKVFSLEDIRDCGS